MMRGYDGVRFRIPNTPLVRGIVATVKAVGMFIVAAAMLAAFWAITVGIFLL